MEGKRAAPQGSALPSGPRAEAIARGGPSNSRQIHHRSTPGRLAESAEVPERNLRARVAWTKRVVLLLRSEWRAATPTVRRTRAAWASIPQPHGWWQTDAR